MIRWLKLALGIVLLLVPFAFVDWQATARALLQADLWPLVLALLVLVTNLPLSAFKWHLLLRVHGLRPGFPAATPSAHRAAIP
ncbi:MAG: lysylphosphatidylglycerol synthase domain-containing protein, partial [Geminicoccaceae bacterium]|nr:lysylphosphatidylglycerol synthase domain-containing protein [Geminicoccaceae bacterium]